MTHDPLSHCLLWFDYIRPEWNLYFQNITVGNLRNRRRATLIWNTSREWTSEWEAALNSRKGWNLCSRTEFTCSLSCMAWPMPSSVADSYCSEPNTSNNSFNWQHQRQLSSTVSLFIFSSISKQSVVSNFIETTAEELIPTVFIVLETCVFSFGSKR